MEKNMFRSVRRSLREGYIVVVFSHGGHTTINDAMMKGWLDKFSVVRYVHPHGMFRKNLKRADNKKLKEEREWQRATKKCHPSLLS